MPAARNGRCKTPSIAPNAGDIANAGGDAISRGGDALFFSDGNLVVRTAVPDAEETQRLTGLDLYDQGIQPVWLQVENSGDRPARYAPVSTDPEYFAPLEVSYMNRRGYSDAARESMKQALELDPTPVQELVALVQIDLQAQAVGRLGHRPHVEMGFGPAARQDRPRRLELKRFLASKPPNWGTGGCGPMTFSNEGMTSTST